MTCAVPQSLARQPLHNRQGTVHIWEQPRRCARTTARWRATLLRKKHNSVDIESGSLHHQRMQETLCTTLTMTTRCGIPFARTRCVWFSCLFIAQGRCQRVRLQIRYSVRLRSPVSGSNDKSCISCHRSTRCSNAAGLNDRLSWQSPLRSDTVVSSSHNLDSPLQKKKNSRNLACARRLHGTSSSDLHCSTS